MIINENPNNIKTVANTHYGASGATAFVLFNKFYVHSDWAWASHDTLLRYIALYIQHEKKELANQFREKNKIKHIGDLTGEEVDKLNSERDIDRHIILEISPYVIQGRLWRTTKMISFWNDLVYIASRKNDIIKFIESLNNDPKKYQYEIKDKLYDYNQFLSGKYTDDLEFDPEVVHMLPPDKKGEALKKMGVRPKAPVPLQFKQMVQGESFRSWLQKGEKNG
jgi:hypothetical protein